MCSWSWSTSFQRSAAIIRGSSVVRGFSYDFYFLAKTRPESSECKKNSYENIRKKAANSRKIMQKAENSKSVSIRFVMSARSERIIKNHQLNLPNRSGKVWVKPMSGKLGSCATLVKGCAMTCPQDTAEKKSGQLMNQIGVSCLEGFWRQPVANLKISWYIWYTM